MFMRTAYAAITCCLAVIYTQNGAAQTPPPNVTFEVPLSLTRLPSQIQKVRLLCSIASSALQPGSDGLRRRYGEIEIPVSQGGVAQTVQVVMTLTDQDLGNNPSGQPASYTCELAGFSTTVARGWATFHGSTQNDPLFFLAPAPPSSLTGSFVW